MSVLSGSLIRHKGIIVPHVPRTEQTWKFKNDEVRLSYGESFAGYDVRVEFDGEGRIQNRKMHPGEFCLASTVESFIMPQDVIGVVHDKSSWARRGLCVQNTIIE